MDKEEEQVENAGSSHTVRVASNTELLAVTRSNNELMVISLRKSSPSWILEFGGTFHMCLNKEGFDTYEDKDGGEVMMVDKSTCKVLGVITLMIGIL